jgi:hypothetical protein
MLQKKAVRYRKESHGVYVVYAYGVRNAFGNSRDAKRFFRLCNLNQKTAA